MRVRNIYADTSKGQVLCGWDKHFSKEDKREEMYVVKEGEVDIVLMDSNSKLFWLTASLANSA